MYDEANEGKYATINQFYYPTTQHPDVVAKFNSLPHITETDKYLQENIKNSMRYDMNKIIPSWTEITATQFNRRLTRRRTVRYPTWNRS